ncbi:lytic transglycosylase domain-containing protein [Actinokineospora sp. 24-640]
MGAKKGGQHRKRRERGRRRSAVAAAGAMLMVPAVVAGEPAPWLSPTGDVALAGSAEGGLPGLTDPGTVGADGSLPESGRIGPQILALAGKPELLALTGGPTAGYPRGPLGIPGNMLSAYMRAAQTLAAQQPGCRMTWSLLASIGRIESNHARGGAVDAAGTTLRPILGPVLNGGGFAAISDTDGGSYDGDSRWDRAVGPMQFIPSTWAGYAADGNGDGQRNPNNIHDAAVGAGKYLCSGGMNLSNPQQLAAAVWRYNHSDSYVRTVIQWSDLYAKGVTPMAPTPVHQIQQPYIPPAYQDDAELPPTSRPNPRPGTSATPTTSRPASPTSSTPRPTSPTPTSTWDQTSGRPAKPTTTVTTQPTCATPPTSPTTTTSTAPTTTSAPADPCVTEPSESPEPSQPPQPSGPTGEDTSSPTGESTSSTTGGSTSSTPAENTSSTPGGDTPVTTSSTRSSTAGRRRSTAQGR